MRLDQLKPNILVRGAIFPEPVQVIAVLPQHPKIHVVQDPVRLGWEPLVKIEHYHIASEKILEAAT